MNSAKPLPKAHRYVALLRGINVGGKHIVPMQQLSEIFTQAGCSNVRTYIQSGNVVFTAPPKVVASLPKVVAKQIEKRFGFSAPIVLRNIEQLTRAVSSNPFLKAGVPEKELYLYFLADLPSLDAVGTLDPSRSAPDAYHLAETHIHLHLPNGMGRSKLTNAYFDAKLSTVCTARNWATVLKLLEMMQA